MTKSNLPELLAPAGGMDAALAAFHFGADAVYLGLRKFSARAEAENFDGEALDRVTAYAHGQPRPRKVYVAINTLIQERELKDVAKALALVRECAVDGVILQDLAVARMAKRHFPELELHASTQMAVHSRAGVEEMARQGFARVVLSRELTLDEIAEAAKVDGMEIEVFLHGALCYALSGQCMFSSMLYGKSGNRGACAYPCRDLWTIQGGAFDPRLKVGDAGHCFSMKDLALERLVGDLADAGVASLKIEGRKKSPVYVAAAVDHYRHLLDGDAEGSSERAAAIRTIFSRPWTELFLRGRRNDATIDTTFVGHRGQPVGLVESVRRQGQSPTAIRFTTHRRLEKHDGLQIEVPGEDRPFGFGVDGMRVLEGGKASPAVAAPAFSKVEVDLPPGAPRLEAGMEVRLSSSNEVKRSLAFTPPNVGPFRRRWPLVVEAVLRESMLTVDGRVEGERGQCLASATAKLDGPFDRARDASKTADGMARSLGKLGDTRFALSSFRLDDPHGLFVPLSRLNDLRRELADRLDAKLKEAESRGLDAALADLDAEAAEAFLGSGDAVQDRSGSAGPKWILKVDRLSLLGDLEGEEWDLADEYLVDVPMDGDALRAWNDFPQSRFLDAAKVRWSVPAFVRNPESRALESNLKRLADAGFRRFQAGNPAALVHLENAGLSLRGENPGSRADVAAGWQMHAMNSQSALALSELGLTRLTLSPEDNLANWKELSPALLARSVAIVWQDTPLFVAESCPHAAFLGHCPGPASCRFKDFQLSGSRGTRVHAYSRACRTYVVNEAPLNLTREARSIGELGVGWLRADFAIRPYSPAQVREFWLSMRRGCPLKGGHGANFRRGF